MSVRVAINGFGRIGRLVFRAAMNNKFVDVVAINDLTDTRTMAHLLKYDSVHGILDADVTSTEDAIVLNGKPIALTAIKDPAQLRWKDFNVDIVMELDLVVRILERPKNGALGIDDFNDAATAARAKATGAT